MNKHNHPVVTTSELTRDLLALPAKIRDAQRAVSKSRIAWEIRASEVSLKALEMPMFTVKGSDEKRPASNDKERDLAVDFALAHDETHEILKAQLDTAQRELAYYQNQYRAVRMAARLTYVGSSDE